MKNFFYCIISLLLLTACGGEERVVQRPMYNLLLPYVEYTGSLESLAKLALAIEGNVAAKAAECYGDELPQEFTASRERFLAAVDSKLAEFKKGHFVELRTVLYESAAEVYAKTASEAGRTAMRNMLKHCSAALYIDGQRACDPPAAVRERYAKAKEKVLVRGEI